MFEVLRERGLASSFVTPITQEMLELLEFAFVDDTDLIKGGNQNDPEATIRKMEEMVGCCEGLAKTTQFETF